MKGVFTENGEYYINIAVDFEHLTPDWQQANLNMALFVIEMLVNTEFACTEEKYYHEIHQYWLSQNEWARGGPLGLPYNELPEVEKAKDRLIYDICSTQFKNKILLN